MNNYDPLGDAFSLMRMQSELMAKDAEIDKLRHQVEALREAGDSMWYCFRHLKRVNKSEIEDAIDDWNYARNGVTK